jgi:hypothetical protein
MKAAIILAAIGLVLAQVGPVPAAEIGKVAAGQGGLLRAAERGDPRAQTRIGFMYETGHGLPQDYMLAVAWYQRAAEQGYPRAQHLLGMMYQRAQGVAEDYVTAYKWLNLAAAAVQNRGERDFYLRTRDAVGWKMTVAQVTEAQWRSRHWQPRSER